MRSLNKNKQLIRYSLQIKTEDVYVTDRDGNIVYENVNGKLVPQIKKKGAESYAVPKEIWGNIHSSGGETDAMNYGVSTADYDAVLYTPKGTVELQETSLIWYDSEPKYKDDAETEVDPTSADYIVKRVPPCLDERIYLLKRVDK